MMRTLIIDDEELARKRILNLLSNVPEIEIVGECVNGKSAVLKINEQHPDLIFLDINMKDMNGFEVLKKITISSKPIIVFVTAYDNYALKAFDVNAYDFLLKPFKDERFYRSIEKIMKVSKTEAEDNFNNKIIELFNLHKQEQDELNTKLKLPIKQGNKTLLIDPKDILYIKASGYYAEIFVDDKKYVLRETLTNLCESLNDPRFIRVHRSTVINLDHVREIVHSDYSEIDAKMEDGELLHISKSHKKEFLEKIGI